EADIAEMMQNAELPDVFRQSGIIAAIRASTSGHPALVAATLRNAQSRAKAGQLDVMAIVTGEPVRPVRAETRKRLLALLPDPAARELLDRLSLVTGAFEREMAFTVSHVAPAIPAAGDTIQRLRDIWLEEPQPGRFAVSPLLTGVGAETLEA